jgi:simple sugar transport system permease protein
VAGPIGQLTPYVPAGYGFAAIIVAFVGRLHPVGMVFSAILMSMFYIGGELAQSRLGLPKSLTGVFQGLLLFALLACDTLIAYRIRWPTTRPGGPLMDPTHCCWRHAQRRHRAGHGGPGPADQRKPASSTSAPKA